jgi:hypothetical protein
MVTGMAALVAGSAIVLARADAGTVSAPPVVGSPTGESPRVIQRDGNSALVQVGIARTAGPVASVREGRDGHAVTGTGHRAPTVSASALTGT